MYKGLLVFIVLMSQSLDSSHSMVWSLLKNVLVRTCLFSKMFEMGGWCVEYHAGLWKCNNLWHKYG